MGCKVEGFKSDVISTFGEDAYAAFDKYMEAAFNDKTHEDPVWTMTHEIEKHDALNFSYHFNFWRDTGKHCDDEIACTFYTGIDVGCEMVDYSLDGDSIASRPCYERVIVGIKPAWYNYELREGDISEQRRALITAVVKGREEQIMDILRKQNYDNYVTGGGTCKTNEHYRELFDKYEDSGIFWEPVYEEVEVDRNII